MSHRDEHQGAGYVAPKRGAAQPYARDEDFIRGGAGEAGVRGLKRSVVASVLRLILVVLVIVLVLGGGLFAAIQFRLIDPAGLGIDAAGLLGGGGATTRPEAEADVIFAGDTSVLATAPGNTVQADPSDSSAWLRTTVKSASAAGVTDGVSAVIPAALLPKFEGRRVRVTISAKSGAEGTPVPFAAAYSAGSKGNSNWIVFVPQKTFTDHSFSFVVPIGEIGGSEDPHRIAIWSDIEGRGVPLAIRSITIQPD